MYAWNPVKVSHFSAVLMRVLEIMPEVQKYILLMAFGLIYHSNLAGSPFQQIILIPYVRR